MKYQRLGMGLLSLSMTTLWLWAAEAKNANNDLHFDGSTAETYKVTEQGPLKIHLFVPKVRSKSPRPAIVFFYGGGWNAGSPKQFEQQCRYLASRGMVAMTADYRVASRHGTKVKEAVQDAKSAIRWVRKNAQRLHLDESRIASGGGSAGGHLAACTGMIEGFDDPMDNLEISSIPNAMVLFNPAVTLAPFEGQAPIPKSREDSTGALGPRMGTDPINLSPGHHTRADLPPSIMFFGTEDFLLDGSKYFHRKMLAAGNRCELKLYEGQSHGFFNYGKNKNQPFVETLQAADDFLVSLGYLSGTGNVRKWLSENEN